jgi:hypothetical protein
MKTKHVLLIREGILDMEHADQAVAVRTIPLFGTSLIRILT